MEAQTQAQQPLQHLILFLLSIPWSKLEQASKEETEKVLPIIEKCFKELDVEISKAEGKESEGKWQFVSKKEGVSIYKTCTDESPIKCAKGVTQIEGYTVAQIFDFLLCWDFAPQYDTYLMEGKDLKKVNETTMIGYCAYSAVWPFKPRDFVYVTSYKEDKQTGAIRIVMKSVDVSVKSDPEYVRGEIVTSGMIMTPVAGKPGVIDVQCMLQIDPKGWIPTWLANIVLLESLTVVHLKQNMKKFVEYSKTASAEAHNTTGYTKAKK